MLGDSAGIVMALAAISAAQRGGRPGSRRTFGYHRTEVLAAGLNGLLLLVLAGWIVVSAIRRLGDPPELEGGLVLAAGAVGLVINVVGLLLLRAGAAESMNVRGAYLEVLGDALGSVAVLVSAGVILTTGWYAADPVASLLIAVMIVPRAVSLLREVAEVLLEGTPRDVDLEELRRHILSTEGVIDVHDLHVWTITSGMPVMSAHVVVDDSVTRMGEAHAVLDRAPRLPRRPLRRRALDVPDRACRPRRHRAAHAPLISSGPDLYIPAGICQTSAVAPAGPLGCCSSGTHAGSQKH